MSAPYAAHADARAVLAGLVGHSKAELIRRLGFPTDAVTTIDGERLYYENLDTGPVNGRAGQRSRPGWSSDIHPYRQSYSFRCRTEIVIRDGTVAAYNRSGNDCR